MARTSRHVRRARSSRTRFSLPPRPSTRPEPVISKPAPCNTWEAHYVQEEYRIPFSYYGPGGWITNGELLKHVGKALTVYFGTLNEEEREEIYEKCQKWEADWVPIGVISPEEMEAKMYLPVVHFLLKKEEEKPKQGEEIDLFN